MLTNNKRVMSKDDKQYEFLSGKQEKHSCDMQGLCRNIKSWGI
jgi:hypothetical protein